LYFRFPLSLRDVEDLLAERGIDVSYETVRRWGLKFDLGYARKLRRLRPRPDGRWHLDEMFVSINGKRMYLWRAVDSESEVLDILVQSRRNKNAALKMMRKLLKKHGYAPDELVSDKLPSYGLHSSISAWTANMSPAGEVTTGCRIHTFRFGNANDEWRIKSTGSAQRLLAIHAAVYNTFNPQRHLISPKTLRTVPCEAMHTWHDVVAARTKRLLAIHASAVSQRDSTGRREFPLWPDHLVPKGPSFPRVPQSSTRDGLRTGW